MVGTDGNALAHAMADVPVQADWIGGQNGAVDPGVVSIFGKVSVKAG